jgi:threonine synthase
MKTPLEKFHMHCQSCGADYDAHQSLYRCPACKGRLWVHFDQQIAFDEDATERGMWRYRKHLPLVNEDDFVTLGEGDTPLVELTHETSRAFLKTESINPTGTYKDRPASLAVSRARELGALGVTVASDGNTAPAVAAYAAKAGLDCVVFMPKETPVYRYSQAAAFGARIMLIEGNVNDCLELANQLSHTAGYHHCSTAGYVNPYQFEANRTISYEIVQGLGDAPDWVSLPLGGGGLLIGLHLGFKELYAAGKTSRIPRLLPVQSAACAPFVRAAETNQPVRKWDEQVNTIAFPIAVPYPPDGDAALACLAESKGKAIAVTDDHLLKSVRYLASRYGVFAEPAGAVSFAGYLMAREKQIIQEDETLVGVISGTGLKSMETFIGEHNAVHTIPSTIEAIMEIIEPSSK